MVGAGIIGSFCGCLLGYLAECLVLSELPGIGCRIVHICYRSQRIFETFSGTILRRVRATFCLLTPILLKPTLKVLSFVPIPIPRSIWTRKENRKIKEFIITEIAEGIRRIVAATSDEAHLV